MSLGRKVVIKFTNGEERELSLSWSKEDEEGLKNMFNQDIVNEALSFGFEFILAELKLMKVKLTDISSINFVEKEKV